MSGLSPYCCSVHTHATLCDGKDTLETMVAAAYAAGVKYYGVSCHSHTPIDLDVGFVLPADMTQYKENVVALREQYAGRMEILLGLELDNCADVELVGFDYWIGSVHYQRWGNGKFYAADWGEEPFRACRDEVCGGDALGVAEGYFRGVEQMAARKPTIFGHFDLITKLNGGSRFFDEEDPRYKAAALKALHAIDPVATVLEINTGGMARGYRDAPYPALFLLKEWRAMGGRIILTSDAHSANSILYGYDVSSALAKAAGFDRSVILTMDGFVDCPL